MPASFCTPKPNLPVTPCISWLPTRTDASRILLSTTDPTKFFLLELTPPKKCLFYYSGLDVKVGSQEIPGATGKFGFGVQNEAG